MLVSTLYVAVALCLVVVVVEKCQGFTPSVWNNSNKRYQFHRWGLAATSTTTTTNNDGSSPPTKKSTLTDETIWNLRMVLRGVATEQGKKVDEIFNLQCQFLEEEGYEPPQGTIQLVAHTEADSSSNISRFQIAQSRWQLSEDPNDRKDGLWVWGLFQEPLYPFLLLQLETKPIPIPNSGVRMSMTATTTTTTIRNESDDDNNPGVVASPQEQQQPPQLDVIQPLRLYAQLNHRRDSEKGVILTATSDLTIRQMETVNADAFGAAKVNVYEEVSIGTLSIQPAVVRLSKF